MLLHKKHYPYYISPFIPSIVSYTNIHLFVYNTSLLNILNMSPISKAFNTKQLQKLGGVPINRHRKYQNFLENRHNKILPIADSISKFPIIYSSGGCIEPGGRSCAVR